jgi:hypothetical protein
VTKHLKPSAKDDWRTPRWLCEILSDYCTFDGAPGLHEENVAHHMCGMSESLLFSGPDYPRSTLSESWEGHYVFVNPPFDHKTLLAFTAHICSHRWLSGGCIMLCPPKVEQEWFHMAWRNGAMVPIRGRLNYEDQDGREIKGAGSVLFVFGGLKHLSEQIHSRIDEKRR